MINSIFQAKAIAEVVVVVVVVVVAVVAIILQINNSKEAEKEE